MQLPGRTIYYISMQQIKNKASAALRWSEKYTKTDMLYFAKGSFWLVFAQACAVLSSFGMAIVFAHFISKETYGNYRFIITATGIISNFSLIGISTSITQSIARGYEGALRKGVRQNFRWSILLPIIGFSLAIYYWIMGNTNFAIAFTITGITTPIINSFGLYRAFLNGKKNFRVDSIFVIIRNVVPALAIAGAILITKNSLYLIITYFSAATLVTLVLYWTTIALYKPNNRLDPHTLQYAKHLSAMDFLVNVAAKIDEVIVFHFIGAAGLAIYSYAIAIPDQITGLFRNIGSLAFPKYAVLDPKIIKKTVYQKTKKLILALTVATVAYIIVAPYIFYIFFPQYTISIHYSQLAILTIISVSSLLAGTAMRAMKATQELYAISVIGSVAEFIIIIPLVYLYGIWGVIIAGISYRAVKTILTFYYFNVFTQKTGDHSLPNFKTG